ncbi:DUF4143 domain-containing protein [Puniceicoccaceae bacterium K14]|nr:DUF4143 domain-containing protein [Puniceicoccaceae bacterium K14]
MTQTFVLRLLQPYEANTKKRLAKTPKIFIRDSGLFHALLGIESFDELYGQPVFGASWEGVVVESIVPRLKPTVQASFFRISSGDEIDLVLQKAGQTIAIECKASKSPELTKGNHRAKEIIDPAKAFIVAPVDGAYSLGNDWQVMEIEGILQSLAKLGWLRY